MAMATGLRKLLLTGYVSSSVGWLGAAAVYLALAVAALCSNETQLVRAAYLAMEPMAKLAIIPLAVTSLLTGLLSALGTPWGLFRHYWVLIKLLLTAIATVILIGNMRAVNLLAGMAAKSDLVDMSGLQGQILHSGGGLLVLLVALILGIYKPRGMTPYGWRKQNEPASVPNP